MTEKSQKTLSIWLYTVCFFIGALVLIGGYTRLTRSGLSIVEWNVITGTLPPLTQKAWEEEFAKYKETPEGRLINPSMTLEGYETIYFVEYFHRLIGRLAGLVYVLPLFYFLARGIIPWRKSAPYLMVGLGFAFQGFMGWYMVASGLVEMPRVSQYRLAAHLVTALALLGFTYWLAMDQRKEANRDGERANPARGGAEPIASYRGPAIWLLVILMLQITYGAFVAGLKAGHVSNTWPLMFGRIFPPNMFTVVEPWWENLFAAPATVHFIHRWFAFAVLGLSAWLYYRARKQHAPRSILNSTLTILWITVVQITLGVLVVLFNVQISLAIIHQGSAMILMLAIVYLNYKVFTIDRIAQPSLVR